MNSSMTPNPASSLKIDLVAALTSFLSCAYIIVVNPLILKGAQMPFSGVLTATIVVSFFSSLAMGLYAKNPIVMAPGMGINAFFTYGIVVGMGVSWEKALGAVFWSGIVFFLLSVFNFRTWLVDGIPQNLRKAIACGIGLFISFIGLKNAGFVISSPQTLVTHGPLTPTSIIFLIGLLITSIMIIRRVQGGLLLSILLTTLLCFPLGRFWGEEKLVTYAGLFAAPDFSLLFSLDLVGSLELALIPTIFSLMFTDLFDSLSTFVGVCHAGGMIDKDGRPNNIKRSLIVDSFGTIISGLFGTSSATSYIESATGVMAGGRSGRVAALAGLFFLPFLFLSPLLSVIPSVATAPVLVVVGVYMMAPIREIDWGQMEEAIPSFLAMMLIPLSFSITHGIIWGFLSYNLIKILIGKASEVHPGLYAINALSIVLLLLA